MPIQSTSGPLGQAAGTPARTVADGVPPQKKSAPVTEQKPPETRSVSAEQIKAAVQELQKSVEQSTGNLQFSVDDDSGKTIATIIDKETGDVIRQIPSEELMEIAKSVGKMQGLLVNSKA